jgi:hypothetical protein
VDAAKLEAMQARNAQTLKELDERCARAPLGDWPSWRFAVGGAWMLNDA